MIVVSPLQVQLLFLLCVVLLAECVYDAWRSEKRRPRL